jgi:CTP synthase (UTP-ammonia lyase)
MDVSGRRWKRDTGNGRKVAGRSRWRWSSQQSSYYLSVLALSAGGPSVAIVGDHDRSKPSHVAVDRACARLRNGVTAAWVPTEELVPDPTNRLVNVDGIWVAPGSPYRSFEGAIGAIRLARERGIPLFGT